MSDFNPEPYPPPRPRLQIFNPKDFIGDEEPITEAYLSANYLKFPVAQGTERFNNLILDNETIVLGLGATGDFECVCIGHNATGSGEAVCIGHNAIGDEDSVIIGHNNTGDSDSVVLGHNNTADTDGTSIGHGCDTGENSTAIGHTATASGENSIAIGRGATTSTHNFSVAIGKDATASGNHEIVLGTTAETIKLNTITPLYTSPSFSSNQIGYTYTGQQIITINSTSRTSYTATSISLVMPAGLYNFNCTISCVSSGIYTNYIKALGLRIRDSTSSTHLGILFERSENTNYLYATASGNDDLKINKQVTTIKPLSVSSTIVVDELINVVSNSIDATIILNGTRIA